MMHCIFIRYAGLERLRRNPKTIKVLFTPLKFLISQSKIIERVTESNLLLEVMRVELLVYPRKKKIVELLCYLQKWLDYYGPFEAVIDGANVGLFSQQRFTPSKASNLVHS